MPGLTRKDWLRLWPILAVFAFISTFRLGASGFIDPDEPFYALTAKEMLARGDWLTPTLFGQPQFEKPVLAYWVYAALFAVFGLHEWTARLGPALAALGVLVATAVLAKALFGRTRTVFLSVLLLATSGLFITLSRVVLTDMFLCFFTTAAFAAFAHGWKHPESRPAAWRLFFVFMGLGFLTKGPVGLLLPLGSVALYAWAASERGLLRDLPWKSGTALFAAVAAPWYAIMAARHGAGFLAHFFLHENVRRFFTAEHRSLDAPLFYPLVVLFGFFPWSLLLVSTLAGQAGRLDRGAPAPRSSRLFLVVSAAAILVFFSGARSKLISYIFPAFPVLAVLVGEWLGRAVRVLGRPAVVRSPALKTALFAGWVVLPAALVGAVIAYEVDHKLGLWKQVLAAGLLCVAPCAAAFMLFSKGRFRAALAVVAGMSALFSMAAFGWILPMAERYFSSRPMVQDFEHDGFDPSSGTLLAGKMSVRGMSYYSGNPNIAVVTGNPQKTFYTPHPVAMISQPRDLQKIAPDHYPVYGILRPKEIRHLREILGTRYGLSVLDANPQRSIVRLERHEA